MVTSSNKQIKKVTDSPIKAGNIFWIPAIMKLDRFYAQANEQDALLQDEAAHHALMSALSPCQQLEQNYMNLIQREEYLRLAWQDTPHALRLLLKDTSLGRLLEGL